MKPTRVAPQHHWLVRFTHGISCYRITTAYLLVAVLVYVLLLIHT